MNIDTLLRNEAFLRKLSGAQNIAEAIEIFAAEGVTVTEEQLMEYALPAGDELDEEALENVAGGSVAINPFLLWLRGRSKSGYGSSGRGHIGGGRHF